jgi:hypothetical protein
MTYPSGTGALYNFNSFSWTKFTSGADRSPHCTPLFSMILTSDQRKKYTSRYPPTRTTRRHHLRSSRTYRSSVIPPLLHPLPTPLSLKFCDQHSSVRTQTHNLSNSRKLPSKKKMPLKKGTFVPAKKKLPNSQPYDFKLFLPHPVQQGEHLDTVSTKCIENP